MTLDERGNHRGKSCQTGKHEVRAVFVDYHVLIDTGDGPAGVRRAATDRAPFVAGEAQRRPQVPSASDVVLLPGTLEAMKRLANHTRSIVLIGDYVEPGVAAVAIWDAVQEAARRIRQSGGRLDAVYCRNYPPSVAHFHTKSRPGLFIKAAGDLGLDLLASYLVCDCIASLRAALVVCATPIIVRTARGQEEAGLLESLGHGHVPVLPTLLDAVEYIIDRDQKGQSPSTEK